MGCNVCYNVYYSAPGSDEEYLGRAGSIDEAEELAGKHARFEISGRRANPSEFGEIDDSQQGLAQIRWIGPGKVYAAVPLSD